MSKTNYLHEISKGQTYLIDGELFKITSIRATNVISSKDYIIAVTFENSKEGFDITIDKVINNERYKLV